MDELANTLLDRINGLAKKCLRSGENLTPEQHTTALIRITENVRLIKKIEKVTGADADDDLDDDSSSNDEAPSPRRGRRASQAPQAV